jgi:hypothetical protein
MKLALDLFNDWNQIQINSTVASNLACIVISPKLTFVRILE